MGFVDNDLYDLLKINKLVIAVVVMLAVGSGGWRAPVCLDRRSVCWGGVAIGSGRWRAPICLDRRCECWCGLAVNVSGLVCMLAC